MPGEKPGPEAWTVHKDLPYGPKTVRDYVAPPRGLAPGTRGIGLRSRISLPTNLWAEQPKKSASPTTFRVFQDDY